MPRYCPPAKYDHALELLERDPDAGLEEIERLLRKYPSDPSLRHAVGVTYLELGDPAEALPHLEWAARKHHDPEVYRALVVAYLNLDMPTAAARTARRARDEGLGDLPEIDEPDPALVPEGMTEKDRLAFERARFGVFRGERDGVREMERIAARLPHFQAAHNLAATGYFALGDLWRYRQAADAALERAPANIHALLNSVRLELLERGPEAARALRSRIDGAPTARADGIVDGDLARAEALAYLGDADGVRAALDAFYRQGGDLDEEPAAEQLEAMLALREDDPDAPLFRPDTLLLGFIARWKKLRGNASERKIASDLAAMPGLLELIPGGLGYADPTLAKLLALTLLSDAAPPPPEGAASWSEMLQRVFSEGPGERETRFGLLSVLVERGILDPDATHPFVGSEAGVRHMELEISWEPEESGLPEADLERFEEAHAFMTEGDFGSARPILEDLAQRHPEHTSVVYNLAMSELVAGGKSEVRARERLERLVRDHPHYLYARSHLAFEAIEQGDLERARELLALPEGTRKLHAQEYGVFLGAQVRLALEKGGTAEAASMMMKVGELLGSDHPVYRRTMAALLEKASAKLADLAERETDRERGG